MVRVLKVYDQDHASWITLPRVYYTIQDEDVEVVSTMSSGKIVTDFIGKRIVISGQASYIDQTDFNRLASLSRTGGFFLVEYVDLDNVTKTSYFKMAPIKATVFKYNSLNKPVWVDVPLEFKSQEVV